MKTVLGHFSKNLIAGIVALLPVGGVVVTVVYMEHVLAGSWLAQQAFYVPGAGLLAAVLLIYLTGLIVSSFVGKLLFNLVDGVLRRLPVLGGMYQTLKQILGYGKGEDAVFQRVVLVQSRDSTSEELGLVTRQVTNAEGEPRAVVFVPGAPNPGYGRLLVMSPECMRPLGISVNDALTCLVSVGKAEVEIGGADTQ